MRLCHVIGTCIQPQFPPQAKETVERRLGEIASRGRELLPREIHFTTYTLKYNRLHWIALEALGEHWKRARVDARLEDAGVSLKTENVAALTLDIPAGRCPL